MEIEGNLKQMKEENKSILLLIFKVTYFFIEFIFFIKSQCFLIELFFFSSSLIQFF